MEFLDLAECLAYFKEQRQLATKFSHQEQFRGINLNYQIQYLNDPQLLLYYTQWLANNITANKKNQEYLLANYHNEQALQYIQLSNDNRIRKTIYIFAFNMIKNGDHEQILFNSQFSNLIRFKIIEYFQFQDDIEWISYLICEIFSTPMTQSYLYYILANEPKNIQETILIFIFHLMSKSLDERQFPTLVADIKPQVDLNDSYSNYRKLGLQISEKDTLYLISIRQDHRDIIYKIFCLVSFMGGFNKGVQQLLFPIFKESLEFLEIADDDFLTSILRFVSNMVHINQQAWDFLLQNDQYVIKVLSYRKMNELQHREWSTLIFRNLCDCPELRDHMEKL